MKLDKFGIKEPDSSTFSFKHSHKTSGDMGYLIPIHCQVTLPGDKCYNDDVTFFGRAMPTIAPIVDHVDVKINRFYVPFRVLWNKFEDNISANNIHQLIDEAVPSWPKLQPTYEPVDDNYPTGRLSDYLGVSKYYTNKGRPVGDPVAPISAMAHLAYQRVWMDYFVPQRWLNFNDTTQAQTPEMREILAVRKHLELIRKGSGGTVFGSLGGNASAMEDGNIYKLRNVGWNHDYFTNALPTPDTVQQVQFRINNPSMGAYDIVGDKLDPNSAGNYLKLPIVRDLRNSIARQHYMEALTYGGGRYEETMMLMWSQDLKTRTLQRSLYLGGDAFPFFVNEVESNAQTNEGNLGDLAGKPVGAGFAKGDYWEADEFGIYLVTAHIVPKRSYSDAMDKALFFVVDGQDLPNPLFQGIGDEAVFRYEMDGKNFSDATEDQVWGYVPRYSNYKTALDRYSGEMRTSLLHWHLGTTSDELQNFKSISPDFIKCNPRTDIFQVPDEPDKFILNFDFDIKINRKLSANPMPGLGRI